jgi:hypothetical protein
MGKKTSSRGDNIVAKKPADTSFDFGFNVPGNKAKAPRKRPRFQNRAQRATAKLYVGKGRKK